MSGISCVILQPMPKKILIIALVLYIASTVVSYGVFSMTLGRIPTGEVVVPVTEEEEEALITKLLDIDPNEPKDQPCPLNGKMYTNTEREAWEKRRPLAIMIENHPESRPQSGLSNADVVFEAIAEGGVTRFLGMYYCGAQANDILVAPVRSARIYFMELAAGFNLPLYVHVGGANVPGPTDALGTLSDWGWTAANDLNQFSIGYPTFVRNYNRVPGKEIATEHTMETTTERLWTFAEEKRGWTNMTPDRKIGGKVVSGEDWKDGYTPWTFETETPEPGTVKEISYEFWTGFEEYGLKWVYDPETNMYKRYMAGEAHVDMNTNQTIMASNVVVFLTTEKGPLNEKKHMLYTIVGTGEALIFKDGTVVEATWTKKTEEDQVSFTVKGKPVEFAPGPIWVSIVDTSTEVAY